LQNFATSFRWCDYIFGTDEKYRAYKERIRKAKAGERAALEQTILEETTKEGFRAEAEAENQGTWLKSESKTKTKVL
jgi:methylsterol monooxygenase